MQFHVMTKEFIHFGMVLAKHLPVKVVDAILIILSWFQYWNLPKYGIVRPPLGPLSLKAETGRSAVLDVGTVSKIKTGEIQVKKLIVAFKPGKYHVQIQLIELMLKGCQRDSEGEW